MLGKPLKKPEEVFTPRQANVTSMYVERPALESDLRSALESTQHVLLHGESGTGKSWLYKKVLSDIDATMVLANLANAGRLGSINAEFKNIVDRNGEATVTSFREKKHASADAIFAKGGLEHEKTYNLGQKEPFEACCELARRAAGKDPACIVLDNLEAIFDNAKLMDELAQTIILLDDERYAQHHVRLLIVGVPTGVRDYFNKTPNRSTVANRIYELPEVASLTRAQAADLVRRGFGPELQFSQPAQVLDAVVEHVLWVTGRVPQRIHEYCLELARLGVKNNRELTVAMLDEANRKWLQTSMSHAYGVVESLMNERDTKIGRRNQTIYVLGRLKQAEFRSSEIEELIRDEFSDSTAGKTLDCSTLLAHLASGDTPILRRTPKGDSYQFSDPKYRMCVRAMLKKEGDTVVKLAPATAATGADDEV